MNPHPQARGPFFIVTPPNQPPPGEPTYVVLGAFGDICIILPLFYMEWLRTKKPVNVVVSATYAPIFDGVSYVNPIIWPGEYSKVGDAVRFVKQQGLSGAVKFLNPVVVQAYGNLVPRQTDSFGKEIWRLAGRPDDWDRFPLIFDKRSPERETALVAAHSSDKPMILVAPAGRSSPFPSRAAPDPAVLLNAITKEFPDCNVVDLSGVQCERIYDLLGLYDAAKLLISVDTVHLHLSRGSKVPVVALCADAPAPWHGSPPYSNQLVRIRYGDFGARQSEMLREMRDCLGGCDVTVKKHRLIHVHYANNRTGDSLRRHLLAERTWRLERSVGNWKELDLSDAVLTRSSKTVLQDTAALPFVKDMIALGCQKAKDDDIIVLTNDDICFVPGLTQQIIKTVGARGSAFAHRWDARVLVRPLDPIEIRNLSWYAGQDLFAFTGGWWRQHEQEFPDMLLGYEAWDRIFKELVSVTGGGELYEAIYHEKHRSMWAAQRLAAAGNKYNRCLARQWLKEHNLPLRELDFQE